MATHIPANNTLDGLMALAHEHRKTGEIAWVAFAYLFWTPLIWKSTSSTAPARVRKISYASLTLHAVLCIAELLLYYIPFVLTGEIPKPSGLTLAVCILQSVSSFWITATLHRWPRGHLQATRAAFQCMALQRLVAAGIAYHSGSTFWHKASIKLLNNFVWARFIIHLLPKYVVGFESLHTRVTAGVVGCHFLGMWEGDYPNGNAIYMGLMFVLLALDRWGQGKKK